MTYLVPAAGIVAKFLRSRDTAQGEIAIFAENELGDVEARGLPVGLARDVTSTFGLRRLRVRISYFVLLRVLQCALPLWHRYLYI